MRSITLPAMPAILLGLSALASCTNEYTEVTVVEVKDPRSVSIDVEVYDPVTGWVWEGVGVRIVQAQNEWSGCTCLSPYVDDWFYSDPYGRVLFYPEDLALAEVGMAEDTLGRAVLAPYPDADEAVVLLEVWAQGFTPVLVEVPLSWNQPDVLVSVPFE